MASIYLYEPDDDLRANISELLELEGHYSTSYKNFHRFIDDTKLQVPEIAICSLLDCLGLECQRNDRLSSINNTALMTIGGHFYCDCSKEWVNLPAPFTHDELTDGLRMCGFS